MDSKIKKLTAGVALVGALAVGTAGAAFAADGGTSTTTPSEQRVGRHPALRHQIRKAAVGIITDTLGVSRQDLRAALQGGQSLNQYTTSLGKDPKAVSDALIGAANTKLDQLVADGKVTQERADKVKTRLPDRIAKLMDHQFGQHAAA
jgi:hypothetical protein